MSDLSATPVANRERISFFGRRNAGKSTLINALTGQSVAIVSDVPGTTTDPVSKTMEILPLGPCLVTDTAGLDDVGSLGAMRVEKTLAVLELTDIAVWVWGEGEATRETDSEARRFFARCAALKIPALEYRRAESPEALRARLAAVVPQEPPVPLVADLVSRGDIVICVCPIDAAAPKGRLILPQQQVVRELLECGCTAAVCQPEELAGLLTRIGERQIRFVITDSQAFARVAQDVPPSVPLTSFSIVFARQKGDLRTLCAGAEAIRTLKDGDTVLISEGCTHHRQCGDIGTEKLPKGLLRFTGRKLNFRFSSGGSFPLEEEPRPSLVVHCGGCMLTRRAVLARLARCEAADIPVVNYGVALALMNGIVAHPDSCMVERTMI